MYRYHQLDGISIKFGFIVGETLMKTCRVVTLKSFNVTDYYYINDEKSTQISQREYTLQLSFPVVILQVSLDRSWYLSQR